MEATYELWTQVDPASSGLSFPASPTDMSSASTISPPLSPDASGAVPIRVAIPEDADAAEVDAAMRAVEAVAIRAGAQRPRVEVVGEIGERAGLYVLAGRRDYSPQHGFARFLPASGGRALAVAGQNAPGARRGRRRRRHRRGDRRGHRRHPPRCAAPRSRTKAPPRRARSPIASAIRVNGPTRVPLSELGVRTEEFSGRLTAPRST